MVRAGIPVLVCAALMGLGGCPDDGTQQGTSGAAIGAPCQSNDDCSSGYCNVTCAAPEAPIARIEGGSVTVPEVPVVLDGSSSTAAGDGELAYSWSLVSAPASSSAALATPDQPTTQLTPDVPGIYEVQLVVSAGGLSSTPARRSLLVLAPDGNFPLQPDGAPCANGLECESGVCTSDACAANGPPVAVVQQPLFTEPGQVVTLDGSGSTDPDEDTLLFFWQMRGLPPASTAVLVDAETAAPSFTCDVPGPYVVDLYVNDGALSSEQVSQVVICDPDYSGPGRPDGSPCVIPEECASKSCEAGVCKANEAPVADAGPIQYVLVDDVVQLDGGQSDDPEGAPLSYTWGILEAPEGSTAVLVDGDTATPTFVPDVVGVYLLRLVVSDGTFESLPAIVTIAAGVSPTPGATGEGCTNDVECFSLVCSGGLCVENLAPVADAGTAQLTYVGDAVGLDASASTDPEGKTLQFIWANATVPAGSAVNLNNATGALPGFTADVEGLYIFEVAVSDGIHVSFAKVAVVAEPTQPPNQPGDSCTDPVDCTSGDCQGGTCQPNAAPVAVIANPAQAVVGEPIALDGTGSSDADGDPLSFAWELVAVPDNSSVALSSADADTVSLEPDVAGQYVVMLRVSDGKLNSAPATVELEIGPNQLPVAKLKANAIPTVSGDLLELDATGSFDADGDPLSFAWTILLAPDPTATIQNAVNGTASIQVDVPGSYVVQVAVSDGVYTATAVGVFDVDFGPLPVAVIGGDAEGGRTCFVTLDGSASTAPGTNSIIEYAWTFASVPGGTPPTLEGADTATPRFIPEAAGGYEVTLTVTDDAGLVGSATAIINVVEPALILDPTIMLADGATWWFRGRRGYDRVTLVELLGGEFELWASEYTWADTTPPVPLGAGNDQVSNTMRPAYGEGVYTVTPFGEALQIPQCIYSTKPVSWTADIGEGPGTIEAQVVAGAVDTVAGIPFPNASLWELSFTPEGSTLPIFGATVAGDPDAGLLIEFDKGHMVYNSTAPQFGWSEPAWSAPIPNGTVTVDGAGDDWSSVTPIWVDVPNDTDGDDGPGPSSEPDLRDIAVVSDGDTLWLRFSEYDSPVAGVYHFDIWTGTGVSGQSFTVPDADYPDFANQALHVVATNFGSWEASLYVSAGGVDYTEVATGLPIAALPDGVEMAIPMNVGVPTLQAIIDGGYFRAKACNSFGNCGDEAEPSIPLDASALNLSSTPTAVIGIGTVGLFAGCQVMYHAFDSFDPDGTIQQWNWAVVDTPPGSTAAGTVVQGGETGAFLPDLPGSYTLELVVTDDLGNPSPPGQLVVDVIAPAVKLDWMAFMTAGHSLWYVDNLGHERLTFEDYGGGPNVSVWRESLFWGSTDTTFPSTEGAAKGPSAYRWETWSWNSDWGLSSRGQFGNDAPRLLIPACLDDVVQNEWRTWENNEEVIYTAQIQVMGQDWAQWGNQPNTHEIVVTRQDSSGFTDTFYKVHPDSGPWAWPGLDGEMVYNTGAGSWSAQTGTRPVQAASIAIDGFSNDWGSVTPVWTDAWQDTSTDNAPNEDLASVYLAYDSTYLYGFITVRGATVAQKQFTLDLRAVPNANTTGDWSIDVQYDTSAWEMQLLQYDQSLGGGTGGYLSVNTAGTDQQPTSDGSAGGIEFRVPLASGNPTLGASIDGSHFRVINCDSPSGGNCEDSLQPLNLLEYTP